MMLCTRAFLSTYFPAWRRWLTPFRIPFSEAAFEARFISFIVLSSEALQRMEFSANANGAAAVLHSFNGKKSIFCGESRENETRISLFAKEFPLYNRSHVKILQQRSKAIQKPCIRILFLWNPTKQQRVVKTRSNLCIGSPLPDMEPGPIDLLLIVFRVCVAVFNCSTCANNL